MLTEFLFILGGGLAYAAGVSSCRGLLDVLRSGR